MASLTTIFEVPSFLGLVGYYYRFVQDFSKIAIPCTQLTRKWNLREELLGTQENIAASDAARGFVVYSDSSEELDCVLMP